MDNEVNDRLAAAAPVETLPREDLIRECRRLRERVAELESSWEEHYSIAINLAYALRLAVTTEFRNIRHTALDQWDAYVLKLGRGEKL